MCQLLFCCCLFRLGMPLLARSHLHLCPQPNRTDIRFRFRQNCTKTWFSQHTERQAKQEQQSWKSIQCEERFDRVSVFPFQTRHCPKETVVGETWGESDGRQGRPDHGMHSAPHFHTGRDVWHAERNLTNLHSRSTHPRRSFQTLKRCTWTSVILDNWPKPSRLECTTHKSVPDYTPYCAKSVCIYARFSFT